MKQGVFPQPGSFATEPLSGRVWHKAGLADVSVHVSNGAAGARGADKSSDIAKPHPRFAVDV
jgi:hypothetical protein